MAGITLPIGETNPRRGAVQYDGRRIDAVPFVIPSGAGVTSAPIGSIATLQEFPSIGMKIVLGAAPYNDGTNTYTVIGIGFLEAATQANGDINQIVGEYKTGDMASIIIDIDAVAAVPMLSGKNPVSGAGAFVNPAGKLTVSDDPGNVAFPGVVFFNTPGLQLKNQLKTGYCYARFTSFVVPAPEPEPAP